MKQPVSILFTTLVKAFYKEYAGAFLFFFTFLFFIVGSIHGYGLFAYHYSLITGLLHHTSFLLLVFLLWLLYARKCVTFVTEVLQRPDYRFMHLLNLLGTPARFVLFLFVEVCLLLPVLLYAILIIIAGFYQQQYLQAVLVIVYTILLCTAGAWWHVRVLHNPELAQRLRVRQSGKEGGAVPTYPGILLRFIAARQRNVWLGIKLFTCGILYAAAQQNNAVQYDAFSIFLLFNFGIIANGVVIYRMRGFEVSRLQLYRAAAVSLTRRFLQYVLVCFALLLPEFIIMAVLMPVHLHPADAVTFALCSYSLVLLMTSLTFLHRFHMRTYLKLILLIMCIQFIFLVFVSLTALYLLFLLLAVVLFMWGYYRFE